MADADYTIEILNELGPKTFNNYEEALNCFITLTNELPGLVREDVELELVQFHLGKVYPLESKIVTSPAFRSGCCC